MSENASPPAPLLRRLWGYLPFRHMTVLVIALYLIGDQFPFSNFPMYSNFDNEADVFFVTDQKDQPLPMEGVFKTGSSSAKKRFKKELGKICNPKGRDTKQSTLEERHAAGEIILGTLVDDLRKAAVPPGTTELRFYRRTFRMVDDHFEQPAPELLATHTL